MTPLPILLALSLSAPLVRSQQGTVVRVPGTLQTNYVLRSGSFCKAGDTADTSWTLTNATCVNDAGVDPTGASSMDTLTSSTVSGTVNQAVTTASTATVTVSTFAAKASGTGAVSQIARCTGGTATACYCYTSDGSACTATAGSPNATDCLTKFSAITTATVRVFGTATCAAATTGWVYFRAPGDFAVGTGTARFWGADVKVGARQTPHIATESAAVTRRQ